MKAHRRLPTLIEFALLCVLLCAVLTGALLFARVVKSWRAICPRGTGQCVVEELSAVTGGFVRGER